VLQCLVPLKRVQIRTNISRGVSRNEDLVHLETARVHCRRKNVRWYNQQERCYVLTQSRLRSTNRALRCVKLLVVGLRMFIIISSLSTLDGFALCGYIQQTRGPR
jgi:hypothetical protein